MERNIILIINITFTFYMYVNEIIDIYNVITQRVEEEVVEGPGADSPGEGVPLLLSLGQPGLP